MCDICDGKSVEQVRREFLARIAKHDYTMAGVEREQPRGSPVSPAWVYSVGLWTFRRVPELLVVAPFGQATGLIEQYAERAAAGERFVPGEPAAGFLPGHTVMFERVARSHYATWFARAFAFYPDDRFPAMQLVWPDSDGNWPWQARWELFNDPQPILTRSGRPESWSGRSRLRPRG